MNKPTHPPYILLQECLQSGHKDIIAQAPAADYDLLEDTRMEMRNEDHEGRFSYLIVRYCPAIHGPLPEDADE